MNFTLFLRCWLEFAILIPCAVMALLPVRRELRFSAVRVFALSAAAVLAFSLAGAALCVSRHWKTNTVMIPLLPVLFCLYSCAVQLRLAKKLFCFFNAVMLGCFCTMYLHFIVAPLEINNPDLYFSVPSSVICLSLSIAVGAVFFHALNREIPDLLNVESLENIWNQLFLLPLLFALFIYWITPVSFQVVMTGRVRVISLVLTGLVPLMALAVYHFSWRIAKQLTKSAFLTQENTLLRMESKRYDELRAYMDANRAMRHDFRQHLLVISQYARQGQLKELQSYLQPLVDQAGQSPMRLCANPAVDALASHYSRLALKQNAQVIWRLDLPESLPLPDNDYCAMLGNLVENALNAMTALPEGERKAQVISRMLSDTMLGLTVDNPYRGTIPLGKNGLPKAKLTHHGVGLESVANTVNRYHGTLNIKTENQVFSVEILLYCQSDEAGDTAKEFFK